MKRVIIDCDPGVDDAAALLFALASPELNVEAVTTVFGNGPVDVCTANALRILSAAGRPDIPVYQGAGRPLLREPTPGWASQVHGMDALGNLPVEIAGTSVGEAEPGTAAVEIVRRVMEAPGEPPRSLRQVTQIGDGGGDPQMQPPRSLRQVTQIGDGGGDPQMEPPRSLRQVAQIGDGGGDPQNKISVLALGRMTNVALALSLEPQLAEKVGEVVVMGGAVFVPGNVSPVATANLYEDPEAAAILYQSGAPIVQVGLDVCDRVEFTGEQLKRLGEAGSPGARLLAAATPFLQGYYRGRGMLSDPEGVRYNDVPAVAYAVNPGWFETREMYVTVDYQGPATRGQTVADVRGVTGMAPNARVCLGVDVAGLTGTFVRRVAGEGDR